MADNNELTRVFEEGVNTLTIFPLNNDGTYGTAYNLEGIMTVDITLSKTTANIDADDKLGYRKRTSPVTGEGTIKVVGLKRDDYKALYNNITDSNGDGLVFGRRNQEKSVGVGFYNTIDGETASAEQYTFFANMTFELPNVSLQSIAEDDTTVRPFEIGVKAVSVNFTTSSGKTDRYLYHSVNSIDDANYDSLKGKAIVPDQLIKLATPVVSINSSGVASWSAVTHASGYKVKVNGTEATSSSTTTELTDGDKIQVKAVGDNTTYSDSDYSAEQTYTAQL